MLFQAGKLAVMDAASPPLSIGESSYSAAKPKARRSLDPSVPNMLKKAEKGLVSCQDPKKSGLLLGYLGLHTLHHNRK